VLGGVKDRAKTRDYFATQNSCVLDPASARRPVRGPLNQEAQMKIYEWALQIVASIYRLAAKVQPRDKDLATQMRRACASMVLNMAEGMYSQGGRKVARYFDSMGSARETVACLHVCVAARLLSQTDVDDDLAQLDRVIAGLYRLCHKRNT
jgi:four helix bundle protein